MDLRYKNGMAITKRPVIQQAGDTAAVNKSADTKSVTDANSTTDSKTNALKTTANPSH